MRAVEIIEKKKNGGKLSEMEIRYIIDGYINEMIPDYQVSALLMAICFRGLDTEETINLTKCMIDTGDMVDLSSIPGIKVDKHSTGGVGDTTTLVVAPLVAAAGLPVAKMSGKGLGHTGGTIDKLSSIRGINLELTTSQFVDIVKKTKIAIAGQSGNMVPADKKLYSLRDVTATVDNPSLIASSIMSKKIAAGADAIVLDVKVGRGAFLKTLKEAEEVAQLMVKIGEGFNRKTVAILSNMDQPLGNAIGNSLEIKEAVNTLKGKGPEDLKELSIYIGAHMLLLGNIVTDLEKGIELLKEQLVTGKGYEKLLEMVEAMGGDKNCLIDLSQLPSANNIYLIRSPMDGFVQDVDSLAIGHCSMILGAGRRTKEENPDLGVGINLIKKIGDRVHTGEPVAEIHWNNTKTIDKAKDIMNKAYTYSKNKVVPKGVIIKTMS